MAYVQVGDKRRHVSLDQHGSIQKRSASKPRQSAPESDLLCQDSKICDKRTGSHEK
jgi:hypothetical protein